MMTNIMMNPSFGYFWEIINVLLIILLVVLFRYFWMKADK